MSKKAYEAIGRFCGKLREELDCGILVAIFDGEFVSLQWEVKIKGKLWVARQNLCELEGRIADPESLAVEFAERWKHMARDDGMPKAAEVLVG